MKNTNDLSIVYNCFFSKTQNYLMLAAIFK